MVRRSSMKRLSIVKYLTNIRTLALSWCNAVTLWLLARMCIALEKIEYKRIHWLEILFINVFIQIKMHGHTEGACLT